MAVNILVIKESKLDSTVDNDEVYLSAFELVRKDRKINGRNGVCIDLRTNLNYRIPNDLSNDECLFLDISKPQSTPFLVGTWHRPPS
ncbi:hypothetical protein P5673_020346 [Acropora cervicornis]|uniref:Uncharacterized protein n=1 Tax=Acropora cervicornis TaxID=6130 RepID=A0AAD9V1S7_ACRCE|nr:hypothetical protein P5673_020346 [Acropora cervicornis]